MQGAYLSQLEAGVQDAGQGRQREQKKISKYNHNCVDSTYIRLPNHILVLKLARK